MVVGGVVGHGIQASTTMGRLRTAVRTLADIDLAPDELLTHLDDPVSRRCTLARAGHHSPVVLMPGEPPRQIELPAGPLLGLGGLTSESAELELPEGTVPALYTDGLVESRERGLDVGLDMLCDAFSAYSDSLNETVDRILDTLLPSGGACDDVALLLARTRALPASQVAGWDIEPDPAQAAGIRKQAVEQLGAWGLGEEAFVTELVVSELVTNAIRYGSQPAGLRLIHDADTLICEVSDAGRTAPHLRRARTYDEGGRGLLLIAQLSRRWGCRYTAEGKTIWAELTPAGE